MKILCKEPKKDIDVILKKQKFLFVIKKERFLIANARAAWRVRGELCWRTQWRTDGRWIWKLKEKNIYLKIFQEEEFVFSLSACDLFISSIHLLVHNSQNPYLIIHHALYIHTHTHIFRNPPTRRWMRPNQVSSKLFYFLTSLFTNLLCVWVGMRVSTPLYHRQQNPTTYPS